MTAAGRERARDRRDSAEEQRPVVAAFCCNNKDKLRQGPGQPHDLDHEQQAPNVFSLFTQTGNRLESETSSYVRSSFTNAFAQRD